MPKRRIPRCPKCGGLPGEYQEVWNGHGLSFDADAKGRPEQVGYTYEGSPDHVLACCAKCGHGWRLKGVTQITEVQELFGEES